MVVRVPVASRWRSFQIENSLGMLIVVPSPVARNFNFRDFTVFDGRREVGAEVELERVSLVRE